MEEAMPKAQAPGKTAPDSRRFECVRGCSACCSGGPGYVWLSETDADALARHLGLSRDELLERHCHYVDTGLGWSPSINERADFSCVFLDKEGCSVYEARPAQCRTYPFWESILSTEHGWRDESACCPGMGKGRMHSEREIRAALDERRSNPPILSPKPGSVSPGCTAGRAMAGEPGKSGE